MCGTPIHEAYILSIRPQEHLVQYHTVTHSKERSFACRSRSRCVTLSVDLSSVNYERYLDDAGKTVSSADRSGALCVGDVD